VFSVQLPNVISQLEKLESGDGEMSERNSKCVYNALSQLLTYMPLLDIVDMKCKLVLLSLNSIMYII